MEEITIFIKAEGRCVVLPGRAKSSRLCWYAPGLHIYVIGPMPASIYARICNIACNEAISRHIPATSLKRVIRTNLQETNVEDDDQLPLL